MKTFKLVMLIVACGLISVSCSNEELSIDNTATESELFSREPQLYTPSNTLVFNDATLVAGANLRRGQLGILTKVVGKTKDDLIIRLTVDGNVIVSDDGALNLKFGLYTGLKKPDMGGQFYEGEIIMKSNDVYCFTYTIVSDKEIILAEPETCPLEQN